MRNKHLSRMIALALVLFPMAPQVTKLQAQEAAQDETKDAAKELEAARESAKKAVEEARDTQQKLSIQENARKADEKAKLNKAQNASGKWMILGLAITLGAVLYRAYLRRRG